MSTPYQMQKYNTTERQSPNQNQEFATYNPQNPSVPQLKNKNPDDEMFKEYIIDNTVDFSDKCTIYFCHKGLKNYTIYRTFNNEMNSKENYQERYNVKALINDLQEIYDNRICLLQSKVEKQRICGKDHEMEYIIPGNNSPTTYTRFAGHIKSLEYITDKLDDSYFWMEIPLLASFLYKLTSNEQYHPLLIGLDYENFVVINNETVRFLSIEFYNYYFENFLSNQSKLSQQNLTIELCFYSLFFNIIAKLLNITFDKEEITQCLQNFRNYRTSLNIEMFYQLSKILSVINNFPKEKQIDIVAIRLQEFLSNSIQQNLSIHSINYYLNKLASSFNQEVNLQINVLQNKNYFLIPKVELKFEQVIECINFFENNRLDIVKTYGSDQNSNQLDLLLGLPNLIKNIFYEGYIKIATTINIPFFKMNEFNISMFLQLLEQLIEEFQSLKNKLKQIQEQYGKKISEIEEMKKNHDKEKKELTENYLKLIKEVKDESDEKIKILQDEIAKLLMKINRIETNSTKMIESFLVEFDSGLNDPKQKEDEAQKASSSNALAKFNGKIKNIVEKLVKSRFIIKANNDDKFEQQLNSFSERIMKNLISYSNQLNKLTEEIINEITNLEKKIKKLQDTISILLDELEKKKKLIASLEEEISNLKKKIAENENLIAMLKNEIEKLKKENEDEKKRLMMQNRNNINKLNDIIKSKNVEILRLENVNKEHIKQVISQYQNEIIKKDVSIELQNVKYEKERKDLKEDNDKKLEHSNKIHDKEISTLQMKIQNLEETISNQEKGFNNIINEKQLIIDQKNKEINMINRREALKTNYKLKLSAPSNNSYQQQCSIQKDLLKRNIKNFEAIRKENEKNVQLCDQIKKEYEKEKKDSNNNYQTKIEQWLNEKLQMNEKIHKLETQESKLIQEKDDMKMNSNQVLSKINSLESQLKLFSDQNYKMSREYEDLFKINSFESSKYQKIANDYIKLQIDLANLKTSSQLENFKVSEDLNNSKMKIEKLESELKTIEALNEKNLKRKEQEITNLIQTIEKNLTRENEKEISYNNSLNLSYQKYQKIREEQTEKNDKDKKCIETLKNQFDELTKKLSNKEDELKDLMNSKENIISKFTQKSNDILKGLEIPMSCKKIITEIFHESLLNKEEISFLDKYLKEDSKVFKLFYQLFNFDFLRCFDLKVDQSHSQTDERGMEENRINSSIFKYFNPNILSHIMKLSSKDILQKIFASINYLNIQESHNTIHAIIFLFLKSLEMLQNDSLKYNPIEDITLIILDHIKALKSVDLNKDMNVLVQSISNPILKLYLKSKGFFEKIMITSKKLENNKLNEEKIVNSPEFKGFRTRMSKIIDKISESA